MKIILHSSQQNLVCVYVMCLDIGTVFSSVSLDRMMVVVVGEGGGGGGRGVMNFTCRGAALEISFTSILGSKLSCTIYVK